MSPHASKSPSELRQLAMDIANGHVFTSRHIREHDLDKIGMIFMPILFMTSEQHEEWKETGVTLIYEYNSKAGPRSVNGYPMFMSCAALNKTDDARVWELVRDVEVKTKAFLDPPAAAKKETPAPNQAVLVEPQEEDKGEE